MSAEKSEVRDISPDSIDRNKDNPRLFFRPNELDSLLASISRYGIQVPLTVYREGNRYVLIDGERRWNCARKLNLASVPALVQPKPNALKNLLLMFNIHALREQWDYLTIANKLPKVIDLYAREHGGTQPNEIELSEITGLTRGQIRRCKLLLELPEKYRDLLLVELQLPKAQQRLSEDFFIEMEKSLKTVQNRVEGVVKDIDIARETLIKKYRERKIDNIVDFRKMSKIATSIKLLEVPAAEAKAAIKQILSPNGPGIAAVYEKHFSIRYDEKKWIRQIEALAEYLASIDSEELNGPEATALRLQLGRVRDELNRLLEGS